MSTADWTRYVRWQTYAKTDLWWTMSIVGAINFFPLCSLHVILIVCVFADNHKITLQAQIPGSLYSTPEEIFSYGENRIKKPKI